jgi:[histone H3]-lysine4 N-trimethyltransferase SETD1
VTIERDAEGIRSKRYAERIIKQRQASLAKLLKQERKLKPIPAAPAAPPNAPKGPSIKPPQGPTRQHVIPIPPPARPRPAAHALVEHDPVVKTLKRKPYIFIAHCYVPVLGTTIKHLQNRMRMYDWREVRCDNTGYYVVFEDSKRGEESCLRCFRESHLQPLFTYTMNLECQQYGNPDYERSPTPERVAAEQLVREERKRIKEEDRMDYEREKTDRAENLDLARAALERLFPELTNMILSDIKAGIVKPKVFDLLHPDKHIDRRKRLGIADPSAPEVQRPFGMPGRMEDTYSGGYRKSFSRFDKKRPGDVHTTGNAFVDERRRRPQRPPQTLHRRLIDFFESDESDDERRTVVTRVSDGPDSRALSEAGKSPVRFEVDEDGYLTPKTKRPKLEAGWAVDSDQESTDAPLATRKGKTADKEPEDMTLAELRKLLSSSTLSKNTKLYKRINAEIKRRDALDNKLIKDETDSITATPEPADLPKGKKKPTKANKKTKKQILAEAEEASATPETPEVDVEFAAVESPVAEQAIDVPTKVTMGASTKEPKRIVEDDLSLILDLDGWQNLIKNEEDLRFLKEALANVEPANLRTANANLYAWTEKQIKLMNNGHQAGVTSDPVRIEGYYVPNPSGCARAEGYRRIKQDEKGLYLPHRIKVKQQREKLQDEARKKNVHHGSGVSNESSPAPTAFKAVSAASLSSNVTSRSYRAESRRMNNEIQQTLSANQLESSDVAVRFNQLKKRKKLVRFDRSSIHGWGLYTQENIVANDMIIEYVGEKVRQRVADVREAMYDKQGVGSSYLFRIDDDMVIDATKKGGIARFINHSCMPNCTAKIISVGRSKRIVIYALRDVAKGESVALLVMEC